MDKKIIKDLQDRNLRVVSFICEDANGKVQMLSYNDDGLVDFLSDPVKEISINEQVTRYQVRPIATISRKSE